MVQLSRASAASALALVLSVLAALVPDVAPAATHVFTTRGCGQVTIPVGVTAVTLTAAGAPGGGHEGLWGNGAWLHASTSVASGDVLRYCVDQGGGAAGAGNRAGREPGAGGGYSSIFRNDEALPVVLAAGGGGRGGGTTGGHGGTAGVPNVGDGYGFNGSESESMSALGGRWVNVGPAGYSVAVAGTNPSDPISDGHDGVGQVGGDGGDGGDIGIYDPGFGGGGGGGGWQGGAGGAGGDSSGSADGSQHQQQAGGGGAGGRSFCTAGCTYDDYSTTGASVTIHYLTPTVTTISTPAPGSEPEPGSAVTFKAKVTPAPDGGTVTLSGGGTTNNCNALPLDRETGTVTCTIDVPATGGNWAMPTATYTGSSEYAFSKSAPAPSVHVTGRTTLTLPGATIVRGQPVPFTATVAPQAGQGAWMPSGTVRFALDGAEVGGGCSDAPLDLAGKASCSAWTAGVGDHTISATFSGTADYAPVTATATVHVLGSAITASDDALAFGAVTAGQQTTAKTITFTNAGSWLDRAFGTQRVYLQGADPGSFKVLSDGCRARDLAIGASCAVTVAFAPAGEGVRSAQLALFAEDGGRTVALSGTGTAVPVPPNDGGGAGDPPTDGGGGTPTPTTTTTTTTQTVTVTTPAPPAITVTTPAPPATTVTTPAPPATTVTTPAPTAGAGAPIGTSPALRAATLGAVTVKRGRVAFALTCPEASAACVVTGTLVAKGRTVGTLKATKLASGTTRTVTVKLKATTARTARLTLTTTGPAGGARRVTAKTIDIAAAKG